MVRAAIAGIVDVHVHAAPSLVPRHGTDAETVADWRAAGVETTVLKAHEGSTAERSTLVGRGSVGGIVLNAPVGGANPDAVDVAARFGARVAWMPTISAVNHQRHSGAAELAILGDVAFTAVPVVDEGIVPDQWHEVFDVVAHHDMVLASGHLSCSEAVAIFRAAHEHGVRRFLVNHPLLGLIRWDNDAVADLQRLDARLELGILPDLLDGQPSKRLVDIYPSKLLVFGSDLGHRSYPKLAEALPGWLSDLVKHAGEEVAAAIMTTNGRELLHG